jgi:hypothetical protein
MCHTAARVEISELLGHWSEAESSSSKHPSKDSLSDEISTLPQSLMLTVSILNSSEDPSDTPRSNIGDVVIVDILKENDFSFDKQEFSSYRCLETQTLHWPSAHHHRENPTETVTRRNNDPCASLFGNANPLLQLLGWVRPIQERSAFQLLPEHDHHSLTNSAKLQISSGIVAVSLARRPSEKSDTPTADADVLDVLKLMSLDGGSKDEVDFEPSSAVPESEMTVGKDTPFSDTFTDAKATPSSIPPELLLACLSSDGKILFYSPWKLFNSQRDSKSSTFEDGMSSFWFGSEMLNTVQRNILPLSEPEHAVPLSIPFLRRGENKPFDHLWSHTSETSAASRFAVPVSADAADDVSPVLSSEKVSALGKSNVSAKKAFLPAMFNASVWDPTLDPASLCYQTLDNVPTHCVTVHDYVCVAGRGHRRWKLASDVAVNNQSDMGGFVTFVALRTMSEKRTLFLPFAPTHLSPLIWGEMSLLFVAGQGHAAVIRTDGSSTLPLLPLEPRESSAKVSKIDNASSAASKKKPNVLVQRFQILPIKFPTVKSSMIDSTVIGCDVTIFPPVLSVLFHDSSSSEGVYVERRTLCSLDIVPRSHEDSSLFSDYLKNQETPVLVCTTAANALPATWIPISISDQKELWCRLGQGWCAIGSGRKSYMICYEGSNSERGAFVQEMRVTGEETMNFANCVESSILGLNPYTIPHVLVDRHDVSSLFSQPVASRVGVADNHKVEAAELFEDIDDIVLDAMESISTLNFRGSFGSNTPPGSRRNRPSSFSTREKSQRLLRHCSSWTKLEQSSFSHSLFEYQSPVMSIRTRENDIFVLSIRSAALDCGPAAPFQQILAWLSEQQDFFTASSLAFDLLHDVESLRHFWRSFDKIENENELSKLEGLLDGIIPIVLKDDDSMDTSTFKTVVQLADMTVACLIKGGYAMSSTLEQFLDRNTFYDPSRASLMLAASVAGTLSDDESHVSAAMGPGYVPGINHLDCVLWPIRCLLKIGVARDRLGTVLLLLNTTIPDELRRRDRLGAPLTTTSSLDLCKAIVMLIVAASFDGSELLRDLVDERSRLRFWDSLDHETKVELSVLDFSGSYRLLRDQEIRCWVLIELQKCIELENLATAANIYDVSPTRWLQTLVRGCLQNAGCSIPSLLNPIYDETKEDLCNNDVLALYRDDIKNARVALTSSPNSGGLDYDILIPALLLLEHRNVLWHNNSLTCTRTVLNTACYHAGRGSEEEPLFPMNVTTLMRQCTRLGDVEAGGHLVGGKSGLTLLCCLTLIDELNMIMDDAERFVLGDLSVVDESSHSMPNGFSVQECHLRLLWLLKEHVMKIRAYGEFTESRGKVDPVFAAVAIFRTWWALTKQSVILSNATKWLVDWLRHKLRLPLVDTTAISPYRLVCAALTQALAWPQRSEIAVESTTPPLANLLEIDGLFLLQLAQSCCGMVEALPAYMTEVGQGNWNNMDATFTLPSPSKRNTSMSSFGDLSLSPPRTNTVDESFLSAAASYRDLDTSQTSWYTK